MRQANVLGRTEVREPHVQRRAHFESDAVVQLTDSDLVQLFTCEAEVLEVCRADYLC